MDDDQVGPWGGPRWYAAAGGEAGGAGGRCAGIQKNRTARTFLIAAAEETLYLIPAVGQGRWGQTAGRNALPAANRREMSWV